MVRYGLKFTKKKKDNLYSETPVCKKNNDNRGQNYSICGHAFFTYQQQNNGLQFIRFDTQRSIQCREQPCNKIPNFLLKSKL